MRHKALPRNTSWNSVKTATSRRTANSNGLYNHDDIVKVQETIKGKLNEVFLDHKSGLGMIKLLDAPTTKSTLSQPTK